MRVRMIFTSAFAIRFGDGSMERSILGRSIPVVAVVAVTISLTGQSSFSEAIQCRTSPGTSAPQGMHWYYRVDRTNNQHCWYLQSAGVQVRSRENVPLSKPQAQIPRELELVSAEKETDQTSITARDEAPYRQLASPDFTARWLDIPESVDLDTREFNRPRSDYAVEQTTPALTAAQISSISFVSTAIDTQSPRPRNFAGALSFGSIFVAGGLSVLIFGAILRLTRAWFWPRPIELTDGDEIGGLGELVRALRRADETFKSPPSFRPPATQATGLLGRPKIIARRFSRGACRIPTRDVRNVRDGKAVS